MLLKTTLLSFLSNTITKPFNQYFKGYQCKHFDIDNITQVLSKKVDSDYLVILLDINYFSFDGFLNDNSNEKFYELERLLESFRENNNTKIIISNVVNDYLDINTALNTEGHQRLLDLNYKINRLSDISDVAILNVYNLVFIHGYQDFINLKNGFLFQAPWTKLAYSAIATSIDESIQLCQFSRKKVLILDADNTLWGGIVGEDGVVQERIEFDTKQETLAKSYEKLQLTIQDLFIKNWQDIKTIRCKRQKQVGNGTFHKVKDMRNLNYLLEDGWDTLLCVLEEYSVDK